MAEQSNCYTCSDITGRIGLARKVMCVRCCPVRNDCVCNTPDTVTLVPATYNIHIQQVLCLYYKHIFLINTWQKWQKDTFCKQHTHNRTAYNYEKLVMPDSRNKNNCLLYTFSIIRPFKLIHEMHRIILENVQQKLCLIFVIIRSRARCLNCLRTPDYPEIRQQSKTFSTKVNNTLQKYHLYKYDRIGGHIMCWSSIHVKGQLASASSILPITI